MHDEAAVPPPARTRWSFPKKLLFRFGLLYFLLYTHPFPLDRVPNPRDVAVALEQEWRWTEPLQPFYEALDEYTEGFRRAQNAAVDWTAREVFGIDRALDRPYGSGDPTHAYVLFALMLAASALGALLWSLVDRRENAHRHLAPWLHLGGRYLLALTLLGYGVAKVIPTQFGPPSLARLVTDYGHASPMNALWSFMGVSTAYVVFAGAGEVLAAALLLFRRTATLGALVAVAVMTNVVALNFCYDVPVKLYSSHLLVLAALLCLPDARRLWRVLVTNRSAERRDLRRPRTPILGHVVRLLVVAPAVFLQVDRGLTYYDVRRERPEPYGIWEVQRFALEDVDLPPLTTDSQRWRRLLVESATYGWIQGMDDTLRQVQLAFDEDAGTVTLSSSSTWTFTVEGAHMVLAGEFDRWFRADLADASLPAVPVDPQVTMELARNDPIPPQLMKLDTEISPGRWMVDSRQVVGELLGSRRSDPSAWDTMTLTSRGEAHLTFEDGHDAVYGYAVDEDRGTLTLSTSAKLRLERPDPDTMQLSGEHLGRAIEVDLRRRPREEYLLVRRGFHWVNEVPLNRF